MPQSRGLALFLAMVTAAILGSPGAYASQSQFEPVATSPGSVDQFLGIAARLAFEVPAPCVASAAGTVGLLLDRELLSQIHTEVDTPALAGSVCDAGRAVLGGFGSAAGPSLGAVAAGRPVSYQGADFSPAAGLGGGISGPQEAPPLEEDLIEGPRDVAIAFATVADSDTAAIDANAVLSCSGPIQGYLARPCEAQQSVLTSGLLRPAGVPTMPVRAEARLGNVQEQVFVGPDLGLGGQTPSGLPSSFDGRVPGGWPRTPIPYQESPEHADIQSARGSDRLADSAITNAVLGTFLLLVAAAYHRLQRDRILDQATRRRIYDLVRQEPGVRVADLARGLSLSYLTVRAQVHVLQAHGLLVGSGPQGRFLFAAEGGWDRGARERHVARRKAVHRAILDDLAHHGPTEFGALTARLGLPKSTASAAVSALASAGAVAKLRDGRRVHVRLCVPAHDGARESKPTSFSHS
jgi:DNA-binding transcriptional ArsR family regulator